MSTNSTNKENTSTKKKRDRRLLHWQNVTFFLVVYDILAVTASYFFALLLRFDLRFSMIPISYLEAWIKFAPIYAIIAILVFWALRLYKSIWRFASFTELKRITLATIITCIFHVIAITVMINIIGYQFNRMPISYYVMGTAFQFMLTVGVRFAYRFVLLLRSSKYDERSARVMLVGMHSIIGTT